MGSWTDDLPNCPSTGAGLATNQTYRQDGTMTHESFKFRDRSFHCKLDETTSIYGIFSGHNGYSMAEFALQRMTAEILLGQLNDRKNDEEVKDVLKQAFAVVEKLYMDVYIEAILARKTMLQYEIPEGLSQYEISQKYQHILDELNSINQEISVGASVVIALIHKSKLYVLNIGSNRALIVKNDSNNVLSNVFAMTIQGMKHFLVYE